MRTQAGGSRNFASITGREKIFLFFRLSIQIGYVAHRKTCSVGTGVVFRE
jgi:hypothetical protein